ncbi:MAG: xanthine dehydrogenase small subunit [Deltaproteobacteria bacterium CG_4_9_14_3_um_filter_63_12]|nr:MAG: xanthine dehydrogenase small subunit [Deltaproteobacteria bacterium CG_4_9_14_3_um_filter_63_12]
MNALRFYVNDHLVEESAVSPTTTLLYYLREKLGLFATKEGCNEGDCGACTVAIVDAMAPGGPKFRAINSCLVLLPMVQGKRVYTAEGLATGDDLHEVQKRLAEGFGSQCGYCTPGVVMSMFEAAYREDLDEDWKLDDQMCGNLCRCTGYKPIYDATREVAGTRPEGRFRDVLEKAEASPMTLTYEHGAQRYFTPDSFEALWDVLEDHPTARLVSGGTDLSLEVSKQFKILPLLVSVEGLDALRRLAVDGDTLFIGATARLADVEDVTAERWQPIHRMLRFFGARQIKNRATIGGNLCTASPIGDMGPILVALGATAHLGSREGSRSMSVQDFLVGYRQTALQPSEILTHVTVPAIPATARCVAYKVSKRQELDISAVSAGLYVELDEANTVTLARLSFGGLSARPATRAAQAERALVGAQWTLESVERAAQSLKEDFNPISDHRGSSWYRSMVASNLLRGFFHETASGAVPALPYRPTATVNSFAGR